MKINQSIIKAMFVVVSLSVLSNLQANVGDTGWRNITNFGCHLNDGTCYITIDGSAVGAPECLSNSVRFNVLNSNNGKTWLSIIEAAYLAKRQIKLNINGCYADQPSFPTFGYGAISTD